MPRTMKEPEPQIYTDAGVRLMDVEEAAKRWGYNTNYLGRMLAEEGARRIPGAIKKKGVWFIPETTKPKHVRRTTGRVPEEE
jgi:hypothetical protein